MKAVIAANEADGTALLPQLADVVAQQYTIRANLEPRPSQVGNSKLGSNSAGILYVINFDRLG